MLAYYLLYVYTEAARNIIHFVRSPHPVSFLTLSLICQFKALQIYSKWRYDVKKVQMGIQLSDWVENIVGKGEIAHYEQFLLFPQYFQNLSSVDASKWVSMEKRVKTDYQTISCIAKFQERNIETFRKKEHPGSSNFFLFTRFF